MSPKRTMKRPPPRVLPVRIASPTLPPRRNHRLVGCCVSLSNDSHLRPELRPSLNFSMDAISAPQTKASNAARASPAAGRLHSAHRDPRHHNSVPWRMSPWGGRAKPLVVGWQWLVLSCVLCVVCVRIGAETWGFRDSSFIFGNRRFRTI